MNRPHAFVEGMLITLALVTPFWVAVGFVIAMIIGKL